MQELSCDILVVGGGPSGSIAARDLAASGMDVILLEKDQEFDKPCGGGLLFRAYDEFDIPLDIISSKVKTIEVVSPKLKKVSVDISDQPLTIVDRKEFDALLRKMAADKGVRLVEAKAYDIDATGSSVVYAKKDEKEYKISSRNIVAADGVNSIIRKKRLNETPGRKLTYYADIHSIQSKSCQFWFGKNIAPGHYAWIFPHHKGANIGTVSDRDSKTAYYFRNFIELIGAGEIKPRGYYISDWSRQIYYEDGVYFVGDSASMVLPFTYEGIYYAMSSGRVAAEAILRNDPSWYERRWKVLYLKRFRFLRLLQTLFLSSDILSEKLVKLYEDPSFQKSVIGYWLGSREPSSFLGTLWKFLKVVWR